MDALEGFREEIFELYIGQHKRLLDVMGHLERTHNLNVKPKQLKTKLDEWGYYKNLKRVEVVEILRQIAQRRSTGKEHSIMLRQRPVNLERIEKHRKRAGIPKFQHLQAPRLSQSLARAEVCRTLPPVLISQEWRIPETFLRKVDILIKGSFETRRWRFHINELRIISSPNENLEKTNLQEFIADVDNACSAAELEQFAKAGSFWRQAFARVESLVAAQYHNVIPNLLQKINDLNNCGHSEVASMLKKHIAEISHTTQTLTNPQSCALASLGKLEMSQVPGLEERIMALFSSLFHFYLGPTCYNSFVMMMNAARRQLFQSPWATFEDHLPALSEYDSVFGASNRRSMDVISLRVEVMHRRGQHAEVEAEACLLIQRAGMIDNDEWQRFYYLTRGYYFLGSAQYHLGGKSRAKESLALALWADQELCLIDDFSIFNAEKAIIKRYLEEMVQMDSIYADTTDNTLCAGISL